MMNYERNRMHLFNQPPVPALPYHRPTDQRPLRKPLLETPMNDFVRQTLMNNAHVPGLRTGLQLRKAKQQENLIRTPAANEKFNVKPMVVNVSVLSHKIELRWENPTPTRDIKYIITCEQVKTKLITLFEKPSTSAMYLECCCLDNGMPIAKWSREIRAEFSYSELKLLLQKCYNFIGGGGKKDPQMHEFCVVYRCKPKVYWDEIHHYCNDVMQKYIKDDNGQPGNLINGKINGLFFSARLLPDLTLPQFSPFGNVRMIINAFPLLNPERHNFYFADFYCNKNIHYVTVVICVIDSDTDIYCRDRLIRLNPLSNPFVKLVPPPDRFGPWRFYVNYTLWVELYYTEDIQLNMGQFSAIMATGAGTSKIGGLPNNKACSLCNLYPHRKNIKREIITPEEMKNASISTDSTLATILRENKPVDSGVLDVLCYLIDRVEERCISVEELTAKTDKDLVEAVEKMNKAVSSSNKLKTSMESFLNGIATNLNQFVESFQRRRDNIIEDVKKLRNDSA
ncbi:unnamed protein product [Caenorhabditis sp. 36 PRJEB53466]|nr:unnamed protein product [Caenorhabditis sp. 36 PRJEB53466]